jgi:hypothetical protein
MSRFVVAGEQDKRRNKKCDLVAEEKPDARASVTALRVMRPPQPVRVEIRNEQPARIYFQGTRGEVIAASGPWRSSGEWWQEDPWHQDEWDLEVEFVPPSVVVAQHAVPVPRPVAQVYPEPRRVGAGLPGHVRGALRLVDSASKIPRAHATNQQKSTSHRALYRIYFDALRQNWFVRGVYD